MAFTHCKAILLSIAVVLGVIVYNSISTETNQYPPDKNFVSQRIGEDPVYYEHLSKLIQFQTVSFEDKDQIDLKQVTAIYNYIETNFPEFWSTMEKTPVGNYSMIFKWKSADPSSTALPILLMSHLDVVPAESANWTYPPFEGRITDTEIWGRGAIDDKQMVLGTLASVTHLIKRGWVPKRDVFISFGFDEEISGYQGACVVADYLRSQNLKFEFIHDEGMPVLDGVVPGVSLPTVPVGLAEKGALDMEVSLTGTAGHSSIPPKNTIIGILSRAVAALEANPMPAKFDGIGRLLMETLAPDMQFPLKGIFSNLWLFKPLVLRIFESKSSTNALVRTTTAVTIIKGGVKSNVLPNTAKVHLNFRISPLDNVQKVIDHVKSVFLGVDPRFEFNVIDSLEPAPVSDPKSPTFQKFATVIRSSFLQEVLVTPGIMVGNTDTRHFWGLSDNIYRFAPNILNQELVDTLHNVNERISKQNLMSVINFYNQLLQQFCSS
jgi:carboxypeptidase PM20D1